MDVQFLLPKQDGCVMISRAKARGLVEVAINETDWNWPTKPIQVIYDEFTVEQPWGWVFFHASDPEFLVHGRDPGPTENLPYLVNKETAEVRQAEPEADAASW
jgi:hypothetical protein